MLHKINKAIPLTWVTPTTVQVGLGENHVRIDELDLAQQQIVSALYAGIVDGQQNAIDDSLKVPVGQTQSLVNLLQPLIENHQTPTNQTWDALAFAELARTSLDYQVNGEMVLAERWQRNVHIDQLDRTGLLLAKGLLASGIGKVITHDDGLVLNTDIGELGFPKEFLGVTRKQATIEVLNQLASTEQTKGRVHFIEPNRKTDFRISFAITVGHLALSPRTYSRWLARDVNHLAIRFGLNDAEVSPIVMPGQTPCLNCYQESLVDNDESWPIIASQLLDLPRMRDDSAALLTTTGLALRSILRNLDEQAGFVSVLAKGDEYAQGYLIDYGSGNVTRNSFDFHKLCSCQAPN